MVHEMNDLSVKSEKERKIVFIEKASLGDGRFLKPIVESLKSRFNVKLLRTVNSLEVMRAVNWADVVWLEWANDLAIHATNNIPQIRDKKVICRLHGYEVFTGMPAKINWQVVDRLIFVANHKRDLFLNKVKHANVDTDVIRNGIHLDKYFPPKGKTNTKKLVLIGNLNARKGIPLLLHFFRQLLKRDFSYQLYIRGDFQDERLEMATQTMIRELKLEENIVFVGWVEDLNAWLADKSHILSFSLEESFHYTIGEGMAAGLKPVIHAWNESRDIWPDEFIFSDLDEFLGMMENPEYDPNKYRRMISDHQLDFETQIKKISDLLIDL